MKLRSLLVPVGWGGGVAVLLCLALWFLAGADAPFRAGDPSRPEAAARPQAAALPPDPRSYSIAETQGDGTTTSPEILAISSDLNAPDGDVQSDLETVQQLLRIYRRFNDGAGPAAPYNEEIVARLRGRNPKRFAVLPAELPASLINEEGQLLDRWGTPYFMHPVARDRIEIRSAGPDRELWTEDDIQSPFADAEADPAFLAGKSPPAAQP